MTYRKTRHKYSGGKKILFWGSEREISLTAKQIPNNATHKTKDKLKPSLGEVGCVVRKTISNQIHILRRVKSIHLGCHTHARLHSAWVTGVALNRTEDNFLTTIQTP